MQLQSLLLSYHDIFMQNEEDYGRTTLTRHQMHTTRPPICLPYHQPNSLLHQKEENQVQQILTQSIIRTSSSPWSTVFVVAKKKDDSCHFCIDFRALNNVSTKNAYPLPCAKDMLESLHGAQWFCSLDLNAGYWQITISEEHKSKTAFRTVV